MSTHTVVPDSCVGSMPDVTAAATDGAAYPPDPFGADTITVAVAVLPPSSKSWKLEETASSNYKKKCTNLKLLQ